MGSRLQALPIVTPAGTQQGTPNQVLWQLDNNILTRLDVMVPAGHNGNTGIRFLRSQQPVIPFVAGRYLIANNETVSIDYGEELTEGLLLIQSYNLDIFDHTFYLRATMTDLPTIGPGSLPTSPIIASALLTSAGVPSP